MALNSSTYRSDIGAPMRWERASFLWNDNPFTWDDIFDATDMLDHFSDGNFDHYEIEPEKKRRYIRLICKVKGLETYSGQKTIRDDIEITAEDVKLVVEKVLDINLTIENIQI